MQRGTSNVSREHPLGAGLDIFEYSPIGIGFAAPDGRWLKVNSALCELLGYPESEMLGRTFLEITHPEDIHPGQDNLARQLAGEFDTLQVEKRYIHKLGRTITVLLNATLVRDASGSPCHFICQVQDITARKRVEEEMCWKTAFLEAQVKSSLDAILVVDPRGKKLMQNSRMNQLFKIPEPIANDPDDGKQLRWVTAKVRDSERFLQRVVHLYAHPDEQSRDEIELNDGTFLDRYSAPVVGDDGTYYGRIWTFRDITQRKQAEESLRESEARYQRMAANVPGMVYQFMLHSDGRKSMLFVSEGCRDIYGLEPKEICDDPGVLARMVHPEDQADYEASLSASAASLSPCNWQGRIVRPDTGEVRCVQAASRPERQLNGEVIWDGVAVDVTERRQADEHRRAKEEAERSNREKSKFLSRISHELRTPLNAILGFGQILGSSRLAEEDAAALGFIIKGGQHLLCLVDEILDLSRAETGELHLALREVDASVVAHECVGLVARLAAARGISCRVRKSRARTVVWCDELRLRQIMLNLLSNAIKYNSANGRVTVGFERKPPDRLRLTCVDTGDGIPPEGIDRLFVPFERLQRETQDSEGTGLGLVVSKRIADAMGGSVGVESQVGRGSKFWVEVPLVAEPQTTRSCPRTEDVLRPHHDDAPKVELLYIEDNESNLQVVQMALGRFRPDWRIVVARDGREGLAGARRVLPGVILLDLQLPDKSGEEIMDELRGDPLTSHIPIVVLSADATIRTRERVLASGARAYLSKPFQLETLVQVLEDALNEG